MEPEIDPIDAELFELIDDYRAYQRAAYRYPAAPSAIASTAMAEVLTPEEEALYRRAFPDEEDI